MRVTGLIAAFVLGLASTTVFASPDMPKDGAEYLTLKSPQPTQTTGKKVEVIEFFMYHCPACNMFEPLISAWVAKNADTVSFRRIHIPHTADNDPEAHLFLTLDAMKLEDQLHEKVMRTWHVDHQRLKSDADNIEWAVKNGIDKEKFLSFYNGFSMPIKMKNLPRMVSSYGVQSTPTIVVDGRFLTNPSMVFEANKGMPDTQVGQATFKVIDALVATAAKDKH
jgi:thiol:disulfide interchange protein DsbA